MIRLCGSSMVPGTVLVPVPGYDGTIIILYVWWYYILLYCTVGLHTVCTTIIIRIDIIHQSTAQKILQDTCTCLCIFVWPSFTPIDGTTYQHWYKARLDDLSLGYLQYFFRRIFTIHSLLYQQVEGTELGMHVVQRNCN